MKLKNDLRLIALLLVFTCTGIKAQTRQSLETRLVFTFINNIEWQQSKSSISIGVLGNSRILTEISNHIKRSKLPHTVSRINYVKEAASYDIVVIPAGLALEVDELLAVIGTKNILTIAEEKKLANKDIDICFVDEEGKLRYVVNETNAKKKGLKIADKLLDYATEIY
ncbi:MAG: YfiR family protein [Reichenbachiella sp.]|uniref:YfiR family protein n=1 Tax=Reichenbachiella sp. TaxID=2184521 RepID=UPI0032660816